MYIYWSVSAQSGIEKFLDKFNLSSDPLLEVTTWVTILTYSILIGIVLSGLIIIYIYYYKSIKLYRLQNNFISNFTHELKTPITSIQLFLETFKNKKLPRHEQLKFVNFMEQDCNRLNNIVEHILKTAKLESGHYKPNFEVLDLNVFIVEVIDEIKKSFPGVEIIFKNNLEHLRVSAEKPLLEIVLRNLIVNGIKYNQNKKKVIQITLIQTAKVVRLSVVDNGIGINTSEFKNVFKKFYQIGHADNMSAKGSGLGLYISQMIANIHGGKILLQKNEGEGMCFQITLPSKSFK